MKRLTIGIAIAILLALAGGLVGTYLLGRPHGETATSSARYQCPMHPEIVSDKPGVCPICGMKLDRVDEVSVGGAPTPGTPETATGGRIVFYRHPMRPDVT